MNVLQQVNLCILGIENIFIFLPILTSLSYIKYDTIRLLH